MKKFGLFKISVLLAIAATALGRPTSEAGIETERIKEFRLTAELNRISRPCYARFQEVKADIMEYDEIKGDPHYVPECDADGIKWRSSQCDHEDEGSCFCVHEENGEIVEHTKDLRLNKEALSCGARRNMSDNGDSECISMREEFKRIQKEYGLVGHSPLPYYPKCMMDGRFTALQRNDMSKFFCVDMQTGKIIPDTETDADTIPPLTEDLCQAYDEVWQNFIRWNSTYDEPVVDASSCSAGFTFTPCGCPVKCTHKSTFESLRKECNCKPACICQQGLFDLEGKCVTLEECHEAKPMPRALQADKLDELTDGDYSRWRQYMANNPNAVSEARNLLAKQEATAYASGPVQHDPNARVLFSSLPPEENLNFEPRDGEPVPSWRQSPVFIEVLSQGGPSVEQVIDHIEAQNQAVSEQSSVTNEEEQVNQQEEQEYLEVEYYTNEEEFPESNEDHETSRQEATKHELRNEGGEDYHHYEENDYYDYNYTEERQNEENREYSVDDGNHTDEYVPSDVTPDEDEYDGYDLNSSEIVQTEEYAGSSGEEYYENNSSFEEETAENPEPYVVPEQEEYTEDSTLPKEEENIEDNVATEQEYIEQDIRQEEEESTENTSHPEVEHADESTSSGSEQENRAGVGNENGREMENIQGQEPTEDAEHENETYQDLTGDEFADHQNEFTSVPQPEHDAAEEHQGSPPCEDEPASTIESSSESQQEEDLVVIDRVLTENGIIPPKRLEATLEKPSPSVKKNGSG